MGKQSIHSTGHKISHTKPKPTRKNQENARTSDDELTQIKGKIFKIFYFRIFVLLTLHNLFRTNVCQL